MASTPTPRRGGRIPYTHTPKMSERKKGLFQGGHSEESRDSLTKHRLPVVESDSDCDLGVSALDCSSSEDMSDQNVPKTPQRHIWEESRSHTRIFLKEGQYLKNFIKSPFTLNKYQSKYGSQEFEKTNSTPATPHLEYHQKTPSSVHSCASATTSSDRSRARKSLASLIADTESCSSSLKDLNFNSDSSSDSKENTPAKQVIRKSKRDRKMTPKFASFKGVLLQKNRDASPNTNLKPNIAESPSQILKTPHNMSELMSPPKIGHGRRPVLEIAESPEKSDREKSQKRFRNESMSSEGPNSKYLKLDSSATVPKARLSLFNGDRLKEILSAKSFYSKSNTEKDVKPIDKPRSTFISYNRNYSFNKNSHKRSRKPGQINLGVRHRIRKPKFRNNIINLKVPYDLSTQTEQSTISKSQNNTIDHDKGDPFDNEKRTIDALLSQWTEEEIPASELSLKETKIRNTELQCFKDMNPLLAPVQIVPVPNATIIHDSKPVFTEIGSNTPNSNAINADVTMNEINGNLHKSDHGDMPKNGDFLPVDGGFLFIDGTLPGGVEGMPDLDEIEREMRMLDEQILNMAKSNNINAEAVLASTEINPVTDIQANTEDKTDSNTSLKLFPIFTKQATSPVATKVTPEKIGKKMILKKMDDQYVIDAGQKHFGVTQCRECGVIYQIGDPQDEHDHLIHHHALDVLKFTGWKGEYVVGEWGSGRCLRIRGADPNWRRVTALLERVVHPQLGYSAALPRADQMYSYSAYLYIEKKQIIGCLIVEPKSKANKFIPGEPDCCSIETYPIKCGISRLWCHVSHRREGVATKLVDCMRNSFLYGLVLKKEDIGLSAPTSAGKNFGIKYFGTPNFFVYID